MISVRRENDETFVVRVEEGTGSEHTVTLDDGYHQRLTGGRLSKEETIKRSFEFLLQREPKESILSRFPLQTISRYFPEYAQFMKGQAR